ncbi:hypothetical protein QEH59_18740, partial [Coraliomargarita sp. SDUM461004]
ALKRNFYGTIILGLLLPVCASEMLETDPKTAALVGAAMISISIINLSYAKRIEKGMNEDLADSTRDFRPTGCEQVGAGQPDNPPVKL